MQDGIDAMAGAIEGLIGASEGADADGSKRAAKGGVEQADDALAAEIRDQLRLPQVRLASLFHAIQYFCLRGSRRCVRVVVQSYVGTRLIL